MKMEYLGTTNDKEEIPDFMDLFNVKRMVVIQTNHSGPYHCIHTDYNTMVYNRLIFLNLNDPSMNTGDSKRHLDLIEKIIENSIESITYLSHVTQHGNSDIIGG